MRISDWSSDVCSSDLPSTLAKALRSVMADAIEAKAAIKDQGRLSDTDTGTDALIRLLSGDTSMLKCAVCGAQAGTCDCWEKCPCGWSFRKGAKCQNPAHGAAADEGERRESR